MTIREALKRYGIKTVDDIFYVIKPNGERHSHRNLWMVKALGLSMTFLCSLSQIIA